MPNVIFPPRPKSKMLPGELPFYEGTGIWFAQRKFKGSNALIHFLPDGKIKLHNRHGGTFARFSLDKQYKDEIRSGLKIKPGVEYWLNGELMNKEENAKHEIILYDVLQAGRYFFGNPKQLERVELLKELCGDPKTLEPGGIALQVTPRLWLAENFLGDFEKHFQDAMENPRLEGLVLRKKGEGLDHFGNAEYTTTNIIRCRKPEYNEAGQSGGYEF